MDLLLILIAVVAAGLVAFTFAAMLGARSYDRGYRDGARADWHRHHHATPVISEADMMSLDDAGIRFGGR